MWCIVLCGAILLFALHGIRTLGLMLVLIVGSLSIVTTRPAVHTLTLKHGLLMMAISTGLGFESVVRFGVANEFSQL